MSNVVEFRKKKPYMVVNREGYGVDVDGEMAYEIVKPEFIFARHNGEVALNDNVSHITVEYILDGWFITDRVPSEDGEAIYVVMGDYNGEPYMFKDIDDAAALALINVAKPEFLIIAACGFEGIK